MAGKAWLLLLGVFGCEPKVVDAVREPLPAPSSSSSSKPEPSVSPLESSLMHRYSFDGEGTTVRDSRGAAHGVVLGTTLPGTGQLPLAGERTEQYVDLPDGLVSGLGDATFEVWLTWDGGAPWQRIFDFGNSSAGEDLPGSTGTSYLFLSTVTALEQEGDLPGLTLRVAYSQNRVGEEEICNAPGPLPSGVPTHVAVVIDRATPRVALYQDGALLAACSFDWPLSAIDDVNNWLGRSNFVADVDLSGSFDEVRIYGAALTASQLAESFTAGPDAGR